MYRLLGKLIVGMTGFFLLLSLTARALGSTQPPNPALRGFVEGCEDKPQPCWYGIVPQVTTMAEVINRMEAKHYPRLVNEEPRDRANVDYQTYALTDTECRAQFSYFSESLESEIIEIALSNCQLSLADTIDVFDGVYGVRIRAHGGGYVIFANYIAEAMFDNNLKPYTRLNTFWIKRYYGDYTGGAPVFSWRGYIPLKRYCQLQPDPDLCT